MGASGGASSGAPGAPPAPAPAAGASADATPTAAGGDQGTPAHTQGSTGASEGGVSSELQSVMDALNSDRAAGQLSNMPRHIVAKLFPWRTDPHTVAASVSLKLTRAPLLLAGRWVGAPQA